jgi:heat shock protein HspQ
VLISITDLEGNFECSSIYFELGAVVKHKQHRYRGVIVACDPRCMAGEKWYQSNKTQPDRSQPWYHVLVHESGGLSTYVAQSNLLEDSSGQPIEHPRLHCYFEAFSQGSYRPKTQQKKSN